MSLLAPSPSIIMLILSKDSHGRRRLLWFAVTRHPTAEWLAQQIIEAFPWDTRRPT